jgi:cbb3-type cytochrome oxidase subunit 3
MKLSIKRILFSLFFIGILFFGLNIGLKIAGATGDYGLNATVGQGNLSAAFNKTAVDQGAGSFLSQKSGQIVGAVLGFIGVIFLILMIFAGFTWMMSAGNEQTVDKAKNLITAAIIGLIIVLAAYAITAFIGNQIAGNGAGSNTTGITGGNLGPSCQAESCEGGTTTTCAAYCTGNCMDSASLALCNGDCASFCQLGQ